MSYGQGVDVTVRTHVVLGHAMGELGLVAASGQPPGPPHRHTLLYQFQELTHQEEYVFEHEYRHRHPIDEDQETPDHKQGRVDYQAHAEAGP